MPNISSLTMPDGIVYSIKDSIARKEIEEIKKNDSAGSGGSSGGVDEIKIISDEENFVLSEAMTMPELYNKVVNGARIYAALTMPEQEGIIVHDHYMYFSALMATHVTRNGNEVYTVAILNQQYSMTLYLYNDAGSNEVVISEHGPAT